MPDKYSPRLLRTAEDVRTADILLQSARETIEDVLREREGNYRLLSEEQRNSPTGLREARNILPLETALTAAKRYDLPGLWAALKNAAE